MGKVKCILISAHFMIQRHFQVQEANMKEYTLSQQYAIIGLDGQSSSRRTTAKSAALRAIAAARLLEDTVLTEFPAEKKSRLEEGLTEVRRQNKKEAEELEKETVRFLEADGALEEVPDLLGCDMNYYTAGNDLKQYRSDGDLYRRMIESVRGEILEEGPVTDECVCLLWLFRESGCLHDIFSTDEQTIVERRMLGMAAENEVAGLLWPLEFHSGVEGVVNTFLKGKNKLFRNPYLQGVNLLFPFLDRRQAVFVDFVVFGTQVQSRRIAMLTFLSEMGHYVEEVKNGTETLLRIDNAYYRIWPRVIQCNKVPIQGAQLLPVYK